MFWTGPTLLVAEKKHCKLLRLSGGKERAMPRDRKVNDFALHF